MAQFTLRIETNGGSYLHGAHLGTDERVARELAVEIAEKRRPKLGTVVTRVVLLRDGLAWDTYAQHAWTSKFFASL